MLILCRGVQERIVVRTPERREITITVVKFRGGKAYLGIEAAKDVTIHRQEIQDILDEQARGNAV